MDEALAEARKALEMDEVPVGAVIVKDGCIVGRGYNQREMKKDATAHAEILAIQDANIRLGGWRLNDCDMYVTLEPCPMCAGAIVLARIKRLFIGAMDPKAGACGSLMNIVQDERLNHRVEVIKGIKAEECSALLKDFFRKKRIKKL
ncbi:tRNA(adenine34) deaminase [Caldanaerobius fijiensis DSM 17918]|uniref:tRNA-specific adenosine deaminase n=2 Tax=Caldanaerobius TaxID=862261 RepID=A0A1M4X739_9THEO|nr:tRNA(adenine34) deaminase [Caldanaerobius fijiensis DSM 17918]